MADWDQLRDVATLVQPPPYDDLAATARRRDRRVRVAAAAGVLLVAGAAVGVGLQSDQDRGEPAPAERPAGVPSTDPADPLPAGVLPLPERAPGESSVDLAGGRYRVPLDDTLAFEVDVPVGTTAHDDGLFIATKFFVLKTEVAGEAYGLPSDPCTGQYIEPVGPTVEDLVRAIRDLPVYQVTSPEPTGLGGAEGIYVEARVRRTYDASRCDGGAVQLPGNPTTAVSGPPPYIGRWWILDVDGQRVVVQQNCWGCSVREFENAPRTPWTITFTPTS